MFCSNCGEPLQPNSQFCGSCGQVVGAPPQATPTPVAPSAAAPAAAVPNAAVVGLTRQLSRILVCDWWGPLKVAGATLGTSLILSVAVGLITKPYGSAVHWGFKTLYTWLVWWWDSMFGVSLVTGASAGGSSNGASGSGSVHAGIAAMPLTLTVITLCVAAFVFRRVIRNYTSALSAVLAGVRAALFIAIPLWFFSLFASLGIDDLAKLAGQSATPQQYTSDGYNYSNCNDLCHGLQNLQQAKSNGVSWSYALTVSSTQAFFIALLLMFGLFAALTLSRAEWFTGRVLSVVRLCLVAPVRAFGKMAVALVIAGTVFSLITIIVRMNTGTGQPDGSAPSLSAHNWIILIVSLLAYAGNFGVTALGLGSWGNSGASGSASWSGTIPGINAEPSSLSCSIQHGITWWAHNTNTITTNSCKGLHEFSSSSDGPGLNWGVWTAAILAPLVLIYVARSILKANGTEGKSMLISLGTWVLSLLVAIPVLSYLAEIAINGNASGNLANPDAGMSFSASGSASGSIGLAGSATFLVFAYGLLFALIIGLISGAINKKTLSELTAIADQAKAQRTAHQTAAGQVPPPYQG